jgi:hypothetical protein
MLDSETKNRSYAWQLEYGEEIADHFDYLQTYHCPAWGQDMGGVQAGQWLEKPQNSNLWILILLIYIHINMPKAGDSDFFTVSHMIYDWNPEIVVINLSQGSTL